MCINGDFGKIRRKVYKQDARGEILNRLLDLVIGVLGGIRTHGLSLRSRTRNCKAIGRNE